MDWRDRTDPHFDLAVAHHYLEALDLTEAAGGDSTSLRAPARAALTAAGDRARSLGALGDALALYRRALTLAPDDPELLLRVAFAGADSEGSAVAEARRAMALYDQAGDRAGVAGRRRGHPLPLAWATRRVRRTRSPTQSRRRGWPAAAACSQKHSKSRRGAT